MTTQDRRKLLRITKGNPGLTRFLIAAARDYETPDGSILGAKDAARYFVPQVGANEDESLGLLLLDRKHRVLDSRILTIGNDANTIVDPRQIYKTALLAGANAVILAHNHPSGDLEPSAADVEVTVRVSQAGRVIGIELLDHLIIASTRWLSMRERGLMGGRHVIQPTFAAYRRGS